MKGWKKSKCWRCMVLFTAMACFLFSGQTAQAALEDWATTFGLVEKYGNDEDGYFIYGKGDVDSSCLDYEVPFDVMKTEISFKFEAHPFGDFYEATWAYLAIYPYSNDPKWITDYTYEENQEAGRIEFLLEQHTDGSMAFCLFQNPVSKPLITIPDFDFEAVHTLSFEEKAMGTFPVFDGMTLGEVDLTREMQKHVGENAGNSYLRVGGLQQFAFEHLKLTELEASAEGTDPAEGADSEAAKELNAGASNQPVRKLGSLASSEEEEDTEAESQEEIPEETVPKESGSQMTWLWIVLAVAVVLAAAVIIVIVVVKKRKSKKGEGI